MYAGGTGALGPACAEGAPSATVVPSPRIASAVVRFMVPPRVMLALLPGARTLERRVPAARTFSDLEGSNRRPKMAYEGCGNSRLRSRIARVSLRERALVARQERPGAQGRSNRLGGSSIQACRDRFLVPAPLA